MARAPARIAWSEEAFAVLRHLPGPERSRILGRVRLLEMFPEMYKVVEGGRWRGLRRFFSGSQVVFYGYWPGENSIYIEVIAAARRPQAE